MSERVFFDQLSKPPRETYSFLWADYAELKSITSPDGFYGEGQVVDIFTEPELLMDEDYDESLVNEPEEVKAMLKSEAMSRRWADISNCLVGRQKAMAGFWPFKFEDGVLYSVFDSKNSRHILYFALLLASSLRYLKKSKHAAVTASLEEIGYHVFRSLMPAHWEVRCFGAHQRIQNAYVGTLEAKLRALANDLFAQFVEYREFDKRDTGDGGLDVVAWHAMGGDGRGNIPIAFAQCGCSPTDWEHKQLEASPANIEAHLHLQHSAANYYIMPHDLRELTGKWCRASNIGRVIMIDRLRILKLAELYDIHDQLLGIWPHIDEAIAEKEVA